MNMWMRTDYFHELTNNSFDVGSDAVFENDYIYNHKENISYWVLYIDERIALMIDDNDVFVVYTSKNVKMGTLCDTARPLLGST